MTRKPIDDARVWMGKLPREDFDKLLLLTNEAHRRGAREALGKVKQMKSMFVASKTQSEALDTYIEQLIGEYLR